MRRPTLEVADIFRDHGPAYRAAHKRHISLNQLKVMSAIEHCRTAALGGHITRCEDCAHEHIAYNSCRNRHCPKCQAGAAKAWLEARQTELLPVRYFHLVFTLPKPIADIAFQNKREIYNLLMRVSADTVIKIAADPKHLGARVGITSVLHTSLPGRVMHSMIPRGGFGHDAPSVTRQGHTKYDPERAHVHMIVPGGGLSADNTAWINSRNNFFLSVRVLSRLYRRLILEGLTKLHNAGKLQFFGEHVGLADKTAFADFLKPLRKIDWVVYAKEPFSGPKAVLAYLSRYTHRIAISNSRLIRFDSQNVTFRVKDYRVTGAGRQKVMTLSTSEFIRRFLIHVLPKGQHRIRHYGFMGNGSRAANITKIRDQLGVNAPQTGQSNDDSSAHRNDRILGLPCPCCGGRLIISASFKCAFPPRAPPNPRKAAA